jgi:hypothetical protein
VPPLLSEFLELEAVATGESQCAFAAEHSVRAEGCATGASIDQCTPAAEHMSEPRLNAAGT